MPISRTSNVSCSSSRRLQSARVIVRLMDVRASNESSGSSNTTPCTPRSPYYHKSGSDSRRHICAVQGQRVVDVREKNMCSTYGLEAKHFTAWLSAIRSEATFADINECLQLTRQKEYTFNPPPALLSTITTVINPPSWQRLSALRSSSLMTLPLFKKQFRSTRP